MYVDKTDLVYKMAKEGKYYFLSRPRRFGKSLLLSTLKNYFLGNKELFRGLVIEQKETEWQQYPVLTLTLNRGDFPSLDILQEEFDTQISRWETVYHCSVKKSLAGRFSNVIYNAYQQTGKQVVILIDEYDAPFQAALDKPELLEQYQRLLRDIYLCLKNNDDYIRFAMLTGITAWAKVGVFSALNNLKNISMHSAYATLCGITEEELHKVFPESVAQLAAKYKMTVEEAYGRLKEQYDGYHFSKDSVGVYNPFSLLNALEEKSFDNYWIESGRTRVITTLVQHKRVDISALMNKVEARPTSLRNLEDLNKNVIPYLYQAGYLTIKDFNVARNTFLLQVPNTEVRESLGEHLIAFTFGLEEDKSLQFRSDLREALYNENIQEAVDLINTHVFYQGHHHAMGDKEVYCQTNLATLFRVIGYETEVEKASAKGSADIVVKTPRHIYIFEIKLNGTARQALQQINATGYATPYKEDTRKVIKVGLSFSEEERILTDFSVEK